MTASIQPVGDLLREWRQRRRLSQLELASDADISARHLSFLETGRSRPSRDMILNLAARLERSRLTGTGRWLRRIERSSLSWRELIRRCCNRR